MVKPREPTAIDLESESLLDPADGPDSNGPPSVSGGGLRARHKAVGGGPASAGLLPEAPPLSATVEAFRAEEEHRLPITEGDFPLRALAQGLAMLSIDDISRLRLPALPWQTGEDGHPSFLQSLRRKPFKAHYTSLVGFVISTGARACWVHCAAAQNALTSSGASLSLDPVAHSPCTRVWTPCICLPGSLIAHLWCAVVACLLIIFVSQVCTARGNARASPQGPHALCRPPERILTCAVRLPVFHVPRTARRIAKRRCSTSAS